jgi:hypothetical protein
LLQEVTARRADIAIPEAMAHISAAMDQDIIKPESSPRSASQAFSPLGCFIAAAGVTLLAFCLLGSAALTTVWAFAKLWGLPDAMTLVFIVLSMVPVLWATIWTAGRAWHVERRLAGHMDIDVPVFSLLHYFKRR